MKSKMVYGVPATLLCALALTGCPSDPVVMDDAAIVGDAGPNDSGPRRDAGRDGGRGDSGPAGDTGPAIDTGVMLDTGLMADAGPSDDANVDAFVEPDAFAEPDAFVAPDAFVEPDAFVVPDAAIDAFTLPDAFVVPSANDTCAVASMIGAGMTMGTTVGARNDYGTGTGCSGTAGRDVAYGISVPAGQRLVVTVTSGDGMFDPSISLVAGPAATCGGSPRTCLASDDSGAAMTVNRVVWANDTAAAATVFAIVDNFQAADAGGTFVLNVTLEAIPAGDRCGSAITLAAGTTMGTTVAASNDYGTGTSCAGTAGSDIVYAVVVPPSQRATVTVTPGDMMFNPSINLVAGPAATCGGSPRACLDGDDSGTQAAVNSAGWVNTSGAPVTIYAVVDSASATATGPFSVNLSFAAVVAGDVCLGASTLPVGTTMGTTVGSSNDYGAGTGCTGTAGPDFVYAVDVPAGQRATVTVAGSAGGLNPSVNLVAGPAATCGGSPRTCIAGDDTGTAATVNSASFTNTGAATTTIYAVIDTATAGATGTFTATLAIAAPVVGDICSTAAPLAVGTTMGSTAGASNDYGTGTGCTGTAGADLVYAVTVPAGQRATVTVVGTAGGLDPSINLVDGPAATCGGSPRVCLASDDAGSATTVNSVSFLNTGAADRVIYAVVDAASATTTGAFTATLAFSAAPVSITETEPNEDGSTSTGGVGIAGNDVDAVAITNADARPAITVDTIVNAALTPAGDEDVFAIRNTGAAAVSVVLQTGEPTVGVCATADTGIRVIRADRTLVLSDDDSGPGACSQLTVSIPAGTTYYVHVVEFDDDQTVAPYQLSIDFL